MKKIIRGLMYNTETAKEMGWWNNGYSRNDFSYEEEHLFKKRTGEFFIYGWGGPKSKYARATGLNSWTGDSDITPITYEEAQKWAKEKLSADEYESIFGEVTEDGSRTAQLFSLSTIAVEKLRVMASKEGKSMSSIVEKMILDRSRENG